MRGKVCAYILLFGCFAGAAFAQSKDVPPPAPSAAGAPKQIKVGDIVFSGTFRVRAENWNFFDTPAADGEYTFGEYLLRAAISQKRESSDWMVEVAVPAFTGLPEFATAPAPQGQLGLGASYYATRLRQNDASIFVKQAFLRFAAFDDKFSTARFGRFEFIEGVENQQKDASLGFLKRERVGSRLIGNFGFSNVGRSFDGIEFKHDNGRWNLTTMAGRATRGVFQLDGIGEIDADVLYAGYTRQIVSKTNPGEFRFFGMMYHDGRRTLKVDNRTAAARTSDTSNIRIGTFGLHYLKTKQIASGAKADVLLWSALQYGSWGFLEHVAGAFAAEAGIQPKMAWNPWLRAGFNYATGDGDNTDGRHATFLSPLGTPRIYARFPFYNQMNLQDSFAQILLRPRKSLTLRTEFHNLRLTSANDFWYSGGGAFSQKSFGFAGRPASGKRDLANTIDFGADWIANPYVTVSGYYSHAWGGDVIKALFPARPNADFAYLELVYRF
jgi:hypothetical protein